MTNNLLKTAADLPKGSPERKQILAFLKAARDWTPEQRVLALSSALADADQHIGLLWREAPWARNVAEKAQKAIGIASQIIDRDLAREMSLPSIQASVKNASSDSILDGIISRVDLIKTVGMLKRENDIQSADLARDVWLALDKKLRLTENEQMALNRLRGVVDRPTMDAAAKRNEIFKAANQLGMHLPSAMFASDVNSKGE